MRGPLGALSPGLLAWGLLALNTGFAKSALDLSHLPSPRRYWEDLEAGTRAYLDHLEPQFERANPPEDRGATLELFRGLVRRLVHHEGIASWEFWRTIPRKPFLEIQGELLAGQPFADPGRAMLLGLGFRVLGGVSPFLLIWLGTLASLPVYLWTSWEFAQGGRPVTGTVWLVLAASSSFVVDCLALTHSGVGFYLIGLLAIPPFAAYGRLRAAPTPTGLLLRSALAGSLIALCSLCRSSTPAVLPGFLLAIIVSLMRRDAFPESRGARGGILLGSAALLLLPTALARPKAHHDLWISVWEGLGDFDRTHGHYWTDAEAQRALARAGLPSGPELSDWVTERSEEFFRRSVFQDVKSDPGWFVGILARRAFSTLTLQKLREWHGLDWRERVRRVRPNEGDIEKYYVRTATVDRFALGAWSFQVPVLALLVPTTVLLLLWARGLSAWAAPSLWVVVCLGVGGLGLPLLVTTAAVTETEAFALVHFLCLGILVDGLLRRAPKGPIFLPAHGGARQGGPSTIIPGRGDRSGPRASGRRREGASPSTRALSSA